MYENAIDEYEKAGITMDEIKERLPFYSEWNFTDDASVAFESKISAFIGGKVNLADYQPKKSQKITIQTTPPNAKKVPVQTTIVNKEDNKMKTNLN